MKTLLVILVIDACVAAAKAIKKRGLEASSSQTSFTQRATCSRSPTRHVQSRPCVLQYRHCSQALRLALPSVLDLDIGCQTRRRCTGTRVSQIGACQVTWGSSPLALPCTLLYGALECSFGVRSERCNN